MVIKRLVVEFATVFAVALVTAASVTAVWSLIFHGTPRIDWETSFRLAIVLGIVVPWVEARRSKRH